jgi:hypothetical protein
MFFMSSFRPMGPVMSQMESPIGAGIRIYAIEWSRAHCFGLKRKQLR